VYVPDPKKPSPGGQNGVQSVRAASVLAESMRTTSNVAIGLSGSPMSDVISWSSGLSTTSSSLSSRSSLYLSAEQNPSASEARATSVSVASASGS
jgi:hypothetical protein